MCEIYVKSDPIHYELRTRSIRIHGVVTSIRLENLSWDILARIAAKDALTTNQLISRLYDEVIFQQGKVSNFCSFLRVSCMRYLSSVALQEDKVLLLLEPLVAVAANSEPKAHPERPTRPTHTVHTAHTAHKANDAKRVSLKLVKSRVAGKNIPLSH